MKQIMIVVIVFTILIIPIVSFAQSQSSIPDWIKNTAGWWSDNQISDSEFLAAIQFLVNNQIIKVDSTQAHTCSGSAACIPGIVTEIIDGDTIKVHGKSIRFSLVGTPELDSGGIAAKNYVTSLCPVGSFVTVDEDDKQTKGSYGRIIAVVYCNDVNLNEAVLQAGHGEIIKDFCSNSEFVNTSWAKQFGC